MFYKVLAAIIISIFAALTTAVLVYYLCITIDPPYVVVDGRQHPTMPIGAVLLGFICGSIAAVFSFYRRCKKMEQEEKIS